MSKETIINKSELFNYLDWYSFIGDEEITMAICEFIAKQEGELYYSDCLLAESLVKEYKNYLKQK